MKNYSYSEPPPRNRASIVWSCLTILVLLGVLVVTCVFLVIFTDPYSFLNPFPPPTPRASPGLPTFTPTTAMILLPPSWTPTLAPTLPASETPTPTETLPPTPTPITITPSPTNTLPPPSGGYPYEVRTGSPRAIPNIYHPELECNWMGVGGQVVDMSDAPVTGLIIRLGGRAPGISVQENTYTLTGVALNYGRSGYEFKLADAPVTSREALWVQLLNQAGVPLSEQVFFDTFESCEQNLILIDFKQVR
jgi:hypothetical protein